MNQLDNFLGAPERHLVAETRVAVRVNQVDVVDPVPLDPGAALPVRPQANAVANDVQPLDALAVGKLRHHLDGAGHDCQTTG